MKSKKREVLIKNRQYVNEGYGRFWGWSWKGLSFYFEEKVIHSAVRHLLPQRKDDALHAVGNLDGGRACQ